MSTKSLGRAKYKAYRLLGMVHLVATGEFANMNDKADFEQLPFLIFPPMYGFYIVQADISLPATKPFTYEETIAFPKSAKAIQIQDADGGYSIPIAEVEIPDFNAAAAPPNSTDKTFCAFGGPGINPVMVAKCDSHLPSIFTRVFGPDTYDECRKYAKAHGGL